MEDDNYTKAAVKIVKDKLLVKSEEAIFTAAATIVMDENAGIEPSDNYISKDITPVVEFYSAAKISEEELVLLKQLHIESVDEVVSNLKEQAKEFNMTPFQIVQGAVLFQKALSTVMNEKLRKEMDNVEVFSDE